MQRSTQFVTVVLLGVVAAAMSNSQGQTQSGSATSPPGLGMPPTQTQATPSQPSALGRTPRFQTSLSVSIANGSTGGSGSFITPSAGRLVIRTVSMYRGGATAGTRVQCYLGVSSFGAFGYYAMPIVGSTGPFPGTTLAATVYANSTSPAAVNCYRNGSSGTEAESISITGYVDAASESRFQRRRHERHRLARQQRERGDLVDEWKSVAARRSARQRGSQRLEDRRAARFQWRRKSRSVVERHQRQCRHLVHERGSKCPRRRASLRLPAGPWSAQEISTATARATFCGRMRAVISRSG